MRLPFQLKNAGTSTLAIDLGPNNTDRFNVGGDVSLDGTLDVTLEAGYIPSGSYTVLSLDDPNASSLTGSITLDASDANDFSLSITSTAGRCGPTTMRPRAPCGGGRMAIRPHGMARAGPSRSPRA